MTFSNLFFPAITWLFLSFTILSHFSLFLLFIFEKMLDSSTETSTDNFQCSRLFIKNLAGGKKGWNEQKLRQLFEKHGTITDIKLKINEKSGAIKFAFVGFEDSSSCSSAFEKLNGTFLRGKKLEVFLFRNAFIFKD